MIFYQDAEKYHAEDRVSKTALDKLNISPAHYQVWLKEETDTTPNLAFGAAAHCMFLEPALYPEKYSQLPLKNKKNRSVFSEENEQQIKEMMEVLWNHSRVMKLMETAYCEYSVYSKLYGVNCKCKPDILRPDLGIIAEYKTTISADYDDFSKSIANFRYHVQCAFTADQMEMEQPGIYKEWLWICQEKTKPYAVAIYRAHAEILRRGRIDYNDNLTTLKQCFQSNQWPGYPEQILTIELPRWF